MANNFNYDSDDLELDDNGLPKDIITDDEEYGEGEEGQNLLEKGKELYDKGRDAYEKGKKVYEKGKEIYEKAKKTKETADKLKNTADTVKAIGDTAKTFNTAVQTANTIGTTATTATTAGAAGGTAVATGGTAAVAGTAGAGAGAAGTAGTAVAGTAVVANPYVLAAIAIVLAVIIILIILSAVISAAITYMDGKTSEDSLQTNPYITSEYFYGMRTAYIDDEALLDALQLSYKQYAVDLITELGNNPKITININLPDNFDNSTEIDSTITNISLTIGNIVANGLTDYIDVEFSSIYPNIKYFGLTKAQSDNLNNFLNSYLISNNIISIEDDVNLSAELETISTNEELNYIFNLCEKVMIKDFIAKEDGTSGFQKSKYIGRAYMAKSKIKLSDIAYVINNQLIDRTSSIKVVQANGTKEEVLFEKSFKENASDIEIVNLPTSTTVTLEKFTSINETQLNFYSEGLSLFDAIKLLNAEQQYFKQLEVDNNGSKIIVYTWKPIDENSLYIEFTSNEPFMFGEFNLKVE